MPAHETLLDSFVKEVSNDRGFTVTSFSLSGEPHAAAIVDAVLDRYEADPFDLEALDGQKVTLVRSGEGMMGHKHITAQEGTLFNGGTALLPKGKRKNGFRLSGVIDVKLGYGHTQFFRDKVNQYVAQLPKLEKLTQEDLDALPSRGKDCTLAVFGTWRMPDGDIPGAVWLLHSYLKGDDIVEGVLLVDGRAFSEHGSVFGRDLLRVGGKVTGFEPVSFKAAIDLIDFDHDEVLAGLAAQSRKAVVTVT